MVQKKINSNTKNKKRKINNDTTRKMLTRSHYLFKQRLISKAREYPGSHYYPPLKKDYNPSFA